MVVRYRFGDAMPNRASAGTVPASSITIKAMRTFGHFHFRWKWGNLNLKLNIVDIGGLGQRGWEKGREVECSLCCCCRPEVDVRHRLLKLHIEVRSSEAWRAAVWYYGGAHFAGCSWTASQCGQRAGVPVNGQWRGVMVVEHTSSAYVQVDLRASGQSRAAVCTGRCGMLG
jgi:hypothetical protein